MMLVWTEIVKDQEVLQRLNIGRYFSDCHVKLELCIRFFFVSWIVAYIKLFVLYCSIWFVIIFSTLQKSNGKSEKIKSRKRSHSESDRDR